MRGALNDGLRNGWDSGEVHVGNPHIDSGEAGLHFSIRNRNHFGRNGILAAAVHNSCEIVLHTAHFFLFFEISVYITTRSLEAR
ncbi:hypothetical protein SDC9_78988 [bioreactor metagenome]|uniref:Uncharacterized protein n=1 Tax=bioreactor metagenome TaxID=1076179 RepID=A0A644YV63_9ZZZZ